MANKLNDWLVASLNNPDFTVSDFKNISELSLDNTQFLNKELYKSSDFIRNQKQFQDNNGNFSELKFDLFYDNAASSFKDFSVENTIDDYQYSMWDPSRPNNGKIRSINFNLSTIKNPDHFKVGIEGINVTTLSDLTKRELAQDSKIFDPSTGQFLDHSVNDISLFSNPFAYIKSLFEDPLVYATYDKDTIEIDPITGNKIVHKAGEWKVNDDGEYYTEKLNGRNIRGKQVVSTEDYITSENSALNAIDFWDSDDKEKSVAGTIAKNVAAVLPMFVPYVGTASKIGGILKSIPTIYSGLMVGRELAKSLPMAYGMVGALLGDNNPDNKLANTLAAYGQKFTGSSSDYAQENTFAFENFGSLMSDVALQWGQQKFIADTFSKLSSGGETALKTAQDKAAKEYMDQASKYIQLHMEGKISAGLLASYIGTDKVGNPLDLIKSGKWAETALGKAALNKYMPAALKIFENRNKLGQDLSLAYMAVVSNTDVYDSILEHGGTAREAAAMAFGSTLGMYGVDKYLGLGEMFFEKDPARQAFKKIARENADLYISGRKAATGIADEMSTKTGIVNKIKSGIDLGKKITNDFLGKYKDGTIGIVGKAIGEGVEEVSEELVADFTKTLGELAGKLGYASLTDYGAWDDMASRYAMSFLGGAAGGAMFGGVEAWNGRNKNFLEFQEDLTNLIRQGKKDEILKEFSSLKDKGQLGSLDLSYDTTTNSEGTQTYLTVDDSHISQAESNYRGLSNIVNQLDAILNDNGLKLDDDEVFDKMVQGEYRAKALSDFLKGEDASTIKEASYISKYLDDFKELTNKIIAKEQEILELNNNTTDPKKRSDSTYQEKLQKLLQEKQDLLEQKEYLFGEGSLGYVEKTLFAIDTKLSGNFVNLNIHQFAREKTGKSFTDLSLTEQETVLKMYEDYQKTTKYELDEAFLLYKNMEKQITPELLDLSNAKLDADFKELDRIRKEIFNLKLINPNDKLPTESDEEYLSLKTKSDLESDEEFEARKKAHEAAVHKYNIEESTRWITEFTKNPITSTDFRFLESQIGVTKHELLKYFLDNIGTNEEGTTKHWWEMTVTNPEDGSFTKNQKYLDNQNKDLYDLILRMGVDNESNLRDAITERINKTANDIVNNEYDIYVLDTLMPDSVFSTLKYINNISTEDKIRFGIPLDYSFDSNKLTYKDFAMYLKADAFINGLEPGGVFDGSWNELTISDKDKLSEFQEFYADSINDPSIFDEEIANKIVDVASEVKDIEKTEISKNISDEYFSEFDKFIKALKEEPHMKQLDAVASSTFVKNPVIPLLSKISSFHSGKPVNIEELLKDIYSIYKSKENNSDFQLSDSQVLELELVLKDMEIAKIFLLGASVKTSDGLPIGHNKSINEFIKNHSDVFKDTGELTEIDSDDVNVYLNEINSYQKEINSWLNKHKLNSGARDAKFIKADEALTNTIILFFRLNREGFKIGDVDLLEGYEDLTIENNLSSIVSLLQLLYKNFINSGLKIEEVLDELNGKTLIPEQIINQETAKLDEELTYDKFTQYDKFQLIISSLAVDTVKFYKQLKTFLDANGNIAPISIQEYVGKLSYALKENPELINSALKWIKDKSGSSLDVAENTTIITGLGGSGKTFAAIRLNLGKGEDTWVCGPTQKQVDNLKKSLELSTEKNKKDLMDLVLGTPNPKLNDLYTVSSLKGNKFPIIKDSVKFNKIKDAPKNLVIDEATHFNAVELLMIAKTCKENGINLFILGDGHQMGALLDKAIGNLETNSILSWRAPDLYISLRNGNLVKVKNQEPLLQIIDKIEPETVDVLGDTLYNDLFKKLTLQYYNKDVFSGELITNDISDDLISKIPKSAKIGYVGTVDEYYNKLKDAGYDISEAMTPEQVQGQEFDYVIINKNWELNLTPDNWRNNNISIRNFVKELYTMITRSTEGTIILDNGLSSIIHCSETEFNGKYSSIETSINKFREKRIPEIEKAIADNPEITITPKSDESSGDSDDGSKDSHKDDAGESGGNSGKSRDSSGDISLGDTSFTEKELKTEEKSLKDSDNTEEVNNSKKDENDFSIYPENPITCYSSVSFSGINTNGEEWVNDTNSREDLGIFVAPGEKVEKGNKVNTMTKVIQLKNIFQYGYSNWDDIPIAIRDVFTEASVKNAKFFIKIETPSDSNRLIGLTKGTGLTNEERAYKGKILKLIAKIKGKDGLEYSVSLGGLNKPSTWESNKDLLKSFIKKKIDEGIGDVEALKRQYDSYDDSITKYKNLVDDWVKNDLEIELLTPPKFGQYTRLENLNSLYRLEDANTSSSPYRSLAPIQVESEVHIITDEPGFKPELKGKPVMFVSANMLLKPNELKSIYLKLLEDPSLPKMVRMVTLCNVGVSFESLYSKKWSELYNVTVGKRKFTTPMRMLPFGFRMYKSMWNYRADLNRFLERYDKWISDNNLNDNDINELCKKDNAAFLETKLRLGVDTLSEEEYRKILKEGDPKQLDILKLLWDFNDGLASYVKEFRLGYSSDHGAYLRKLTNIDTKFYSDPDKAVGIYINPQIARTQQKLLDNIFENVIDKFIPPFNDLTKSDLSIDKESLNDENGNLKFKDWVKKLLSEDTIDLEFEEDEPDTKVNLSLSGEELKNKLRALPITMMKLAHYMNIAMYRDIDEFKDFIKEAYDNEEKDYYSLKIDDKPLNWIKFIDDLDEHISPEFEGKFKPTIPGIVPFKEFRDSETNKVIDQVGRIDSRVRDMWNLMFHGVVSTEQENDFTRDFIRATIAEFKYGIFSDPILCELKSDEKGFSDLTVSSNKFFASNTVASGGLILISLNFKPKEKSESKPVEKTKKEKKIKDILEPSETEKFHNEIAPILTMNKITIDPTAYPTLEEYKKDLKVEISDHLQNYIRNDSFEDFENIIIDVTDAGVVYLKDSPEFEGKEFSQKGDGEFINRIIMTDGSKYNLNFNPINGGITIDKVKTETVIKSKEGKITPNDVISMISETISSIGFNSDVLELFEIEKVFPRTWEGNTTDEIDKETFQMYIGKIGDIIKTYIDDSVAEYQGVSLEEFEVLVQKTLEKLESLQSSCFI